MKFIKCILIYTILLFTIFCNRNKSPFSIEIKKKDPNYPTTLFQKSYEELRKLQIEFKELNNDKICSKLNQFGLTGESDMYRTNPNIKISEHQAIIIAVSAIIKNNKFTNVSDSL